MTTRGTAPLTRLSQTSDGRDDIADRLEGRPRTIIRVERDFDVEALFQIERHLDDVQRFEVQLIECRTEGNGRRRCRPHALGDHANDLILHRRHQSISETVPNAKIMLSAASPGPKAIAHPISDAD